MNVWHWINLTNGLQAIGDYGLTDYRVMRLQSTHCEQKRWEDVLASVPDEFLFRLAMGDECRVYDYGANKCVPRAVWQGLEWVRYAVTRRWIGQRIAPRGRALPMGYYFDDQYERLGKRCLSRLAYFRSLYSANGVGAIRISSVTGPTSHDGDRDWMFGHLRGQRENQ